MKRAIFTACLVVGLCLSGSRSSELRAQEAQSLMQITSQSAVIVEGTLEEKVNHTLSTHGLVYRFKKGG